MGLDRMADDGQIACDLADATQIEPAVALAARRMGGIDILVNNAAINEKRALAEIDLDHIDRMLAVNLRAPILLSQAVLAHIGGWRADRDDRLGTGLFGAGEFSSLYRDQKEGILALTRSLARELSPSILVNAVAPGPTDTASFGLGHALSPQRRMEETNKPDGPHCHRRKKWRRDRWSSCAVQAGDFLHPDNVSARMVVRPML